MARYRRYRRYGRRRSTNVIRMKFQSFMDISTSASSMQMISVSAGGSEILRRLAPQFGAYKYYKIGNISVKLVPASTLPVDPTGLSYAAGDNTVDPRDQLTPGLMRITNGEDVFEDIAGLGGKTHAVYNNMLLDPRWYKWMLQSGVKRHATPRYWQIGQLHQDKWPGATVNYPDLKSTTGELVGTDHESKSVQFTVGTPTNIAGGSSPYGFFQTGHRGVLGWLPTDDLQPVVQNKSGTVSVDNIPLLASPPEVEVMKILLPQAYKTIYYYRMFVTETVYFKEPIVNFGIPNVEEGVDVYYRPLDVFHDVSVPEPSLPWQGRSTPTDAQLNEKTGGNYGDN